MPEPRGDWRLNLPNALTIVRLVLACAFFAVLSFWSYPDSPARFGKGIDWVLLGAAAVFVVAALTDALDGYLARRWKAVSVFGRIMDPFADKLLVIGAFVFMASPAFWAPLATGRGLQFSGVAAWMVAVILGRELLVTSIRGAMEGAGVEFSASWSGKWKMILQSVVVPAVLVMLATAKGEHFLPGEWGRWTIDALVWACVAVTVWSGIPYVARAARAARELGAGAGSGAKA